MPKGDITLWPTKSSIKSDAHPIEHVRLGRGRVPRKLYGLVVEGIPVVTTLTMADVERLVPPGRRRSWALQVQRLTRGPSELDRAS